MCMVKKIKSSSVPAWNILQNKKDIYKKNGLFLKLVFLFHDKKKFFNILDLQSFKSHAILKRKNAQKETDGVKQQCSPKEKRKKIIRWLIGIAAIAIVVVLVIYMMPWMISLKDEAGRKAFQDYIYSKGIFGLAILFLIQALQVVVAIIPGEPIEVIAGLLYGTFWGYIICTLGMLLGTILIFYGVKWL